MKKNLLITSAVLLVLAINISAVFAAPPATLHIEVDEQFPEVFPESFAASGSAVDTGQVCASGTVSDIANSVDNPLQSPVRIITALKRFECDDASGTFDIEMRVRLTVATGVTSARWRVVAGTGDYSGLRASGSLVGTPIVLGLSIHDVYDGMVF